MDKKVKSHSHPHPSFFLYVYSLTPLFILTISSHFFYHQSPDVEYMFLPSNMYVRVTESPVFRLDTFFVLLFFCSQSYPRRRFQTTNSRSSWWRGLKKGSLSSRMPKDCFARSGKEFMRSAKRLPLFVLVKSPLTSVTISSKNSRFSSWRHGV